MGEMWAWMSLDAVNGDCIDDIARLFFITLYYGVKKSYSMMIRNDSGTSFKVSLIERPVL